MSLKWIVQVLVQYQIIVTTSPSITGVTYRDHFDFEERYRDVNECNPLYWHPLHLPPYCAEIFEKLIRRRLATNTPVRIMRKREKESTYQTHAYPTHTNPTHTYPKHTYPTHTHPTHTYPTHTYPTHTYPEPIYNYPSFPMYQMDSADYEEYRLPWTPYDEVMKLLKKDIANDPSSPTVTVIPSLGPVALYKQGISRKSENMIKSMAEAYVKATKKMYDEYYKAYGKYPSEQQLYVYDSAKNKTNTEKEEAKKKDKDSQKGKKNKVHRVKTKHGGVVTIVETKNLEVFNKDNPVFL